MPCFCVLRNLIRTVDEPVYGITLVSPLYFLSSVLCFFLLFVFFCYTALVAPLFD